MVPRYSSMRNIGLWLALLAAGGAAAGAPVRVDVERDYQGQFEELRQQLAARPEAKVIATVYRPEALVGPADRDPVDVVLRRTAALLRHLHLDRAADRLAALKQRNAAVPLTATADRHALYLDACRLRREIALANPLLDFDRILFVKRQRAKYNHMCDQFFGFNAVPGGGLCVLSSAFGPSPMLHDVLAEAKVESGRLQGQALAGGAFLSPDLSFDGRQILFAYTECKPGRWDPQTSWHLFKVNADGTGLTQLTDGPWNDFDPCWLPNGRVAFVSERRGGFGRCHGRPVPTYTLHGMPADGSDIATLSFHETNEWQPSVANDGRLVYTRWDYVDRDSDIAHHPWVTTPDGCDARSIHGNFPPNGGRQLRPWMEMDLHAIPGSTKFVATAAPHHGQAYGSFVLLDPGVKDDDGMAQLKRITPEVRFPESEGGAQAYGTAWPLSEDFYLCVYAGNTAKAKGPPKKKKQDVNAATPPRPADLEAGTVETPDLGQQTYGIYLLDGFGNRELLYRDDTIGCRDPIPLRARPTPPVLAPQTHGTLLANAKTDRAPEPGIVTVINVYDSKLPWPKNTRIAALRIIQLFPKATPQVDNPRIGIAAQSLCRGVLGTVPVEQDGSARFYCPPGKALYFQALDGDGLAVQSMRSDTYVQPGQQLTCLGCHDERHAAPRPPTAPVLALRRPPSAIQPDVTGSLPVSFPQLVQPVLDRHCAACHARTKKAPAMTTDVVKKNGWTQAYAALAPLGYWLDGGNGVIRDPLHGGAHSIPGQTGARVSKLYQLLRAGHHDVKLSPEDLHRITLWLDCNSNFYGAYLATAQQAHGQAVPPEIE